MNILKTQWQTSLPSTGDNPVSVHESDGFLYCGSDGHFFKLQLDANGKIVKKNDLPGRGSHDIRFVMSSDGSMIYLGTDGYAIALRSSDLKTIWQTSLPKTGDATVNVLLHNNDLYCGSDGLLFRLDASNGSIEAENKLPDRGAHEVRMALNSDASLLFVGTDGYALGVDTSYLNTSWQTSLPDTGSNVVSVTTDGNRVYCGSNGYVYLLDSSGIILSKNPLPDRGNHEVRLLLSDDKKTLFVGTDGYALGLDAEHLVTSWQRSLPSTGSNVVNLASDSGFLYCGSDGHLYQLDESEAGVIEGHNGLADRGSHEVRLVVSSEKNRIFVGTDGYALATESDI